MIKVFLKQAFIVTCLISTPALAGTDLETDQLLQDVYNRTGMEQQFLYLSKTFTDSGIEMGRTNIPPEQMTAEKAGNLIDGLQSHYALSRLKSRALTILEQELDKNQLENILPLMLEPTWLNAIQLENKAYDPEHIIEFEKYVGVQLQEQPPRQKRVELAYQLAEKTGAVDLTINLITYAALNNAQLLVNNKQKQLPIEIESNIRAAMADMREEYENLVIRQYLYTYRHMSDKQLAEYVKYFDNPSIQALNSAMVMALMEAFR